MNRHRRVRFTVDGQLWGGILAVLAWGSLMLVALLVAVEWV
ncbi:hypothetical protein ACSMX9_22495 [Streptomyces sp. LE64]